MATIKTQLEASGVSAYRSQMSQAAGAVKAMGAELRLAEAEYKKTGDQAQYLAQKSSLLKQQLEEQKKAVSSAEKALELVKKQFGENSTQANAWRQKLAQAKTALTQTETAIASTDKALEELNKGDVSYVKKGLEDVEGAADDADAKTKDLGTSMAAVSKKLDIQTITAGLDKVIAGMEKVMQKAAQMGKAIWDAGRDAAEWADSTRDAATAAHMSTTEYQQLGYAAQFFGTSVEDLTRNQGRLSKAMAAADGEAIQVGDSLVNTMAWVSDGMGGYIQKKRTWSDVLLDTIDALGEIEDASDRDAAAMELFGKSYADLNGIVEGGTDAFRKRMNEAPVVSEDTVNNLADTADAIKDMDSKLQVLKMELLNALAPSIQTIAEAIGTLADNLTKFIQTEEGQKLIQDLGTSIQNIVTALTGEGDFSGIVNTFKEAISGLSGVLNDLATNKDTIIAAVKGIAGAFLLLNGISSGLKITETVNSLLRLMPGKGGAAGAAGSGAGAAGAGGATKAAGAGFATKLGSFASNAFWSAGVPLMAFASAVTPAVLAQNWDIDNTEQRIGAVMAQAEAQAQTLGKEAEQFTEVIGIATDALGIDRNDKDWLGMVKFGDPAKVDKGLRALEPYADFLSSIVDAGTMGELRKYWSNTSELDGFQVTQLLENVMTTVSTELASAASSVDSAAPTVDAAAAGLTASVISMLNGAAASIGSVTFPGVRGGGGSFNASSNLYIGNFNNNSGADLGAISAIMSSAQSAARRAFGRRK